MTEGLLMSCRRGKGKEAKNKKALRYKSVLEAGQSHGRTEKRAEAGLGRPQGPS